MQRVLNQEEIDAIVQAARGMTSDVPKEEKSVQSCDFRQGGQLSRELAQAVNGMFESFARNLSQALGLYLPVPIQALLVSAEQLTYKDFLIRTPEVTFMTLSDKYLWIPVLFALAGVFSSLLPLAITPSIALVANATTLILFIVSLERLRPKRRRAIAFVSHRP